MNFAEQILKMACDNNGIVTSAQVTKAGILHEHFRGLVDKGLLERSERGVYIIPTFFDDEMFNLQMRFKRGIFSHKTFPCFQAMQNFSKSKKNYVLTWRYYYE